MPCLQSSLLLSVSFLLRSLLPQIKGLPLSTPLYLPSPSALSLSLSPCIPLSFQLHLPRAAFPSLRLHQRFFALLKSTSPNNRKSNGSVYLCLLSSEMTGCFNIGLLRDQYQEIGKALGISNGAWLSGRTSQMPFANLMSPSWSLYSKPGKYHVMDKLQHPLRYVTDSWISFWFTLARS